MKKNYIAPELEIHKIQIAAPVLTGSPTESNGDYKDGKGITLGADEYYDFENEEYEDELDW